jgi:hypothetical protein
MPLLAPQLLLLSCHPIALLLLLLLLLLLHHAPESNEAQGDNCRCILGANNLGNGTAGTT